VNYPNAIQRPGPASKQNGGTNAVRGVVLHSMVGTFAGAMGRLDDVVTPGGRASWHYSVLQDGRVFAHYADEVQCWQAGSAYNDDTIGIEHEGGFDPYDEPLTDAQRAASIALVRWLSAAHGFPLERGAGLWEHHEVSGAPTACPSGRIPWQYYTEEHMPTPEYDELKRADQDIETVIAGIDAGVKFLIKLSLALYAQVFGDNDPRTLDLAQRVAALEQSKGGG
jgi:N-acetyl-anhydromuramyl-L-alanine amidase AmpD